MSNKIDLNKIVSEQPVVDERGSNEEENLYAIAKNRYVAFVDVLGFKNMVERSEPSQVHSAYLNIIETRPEDVYLDGCKIHCYTFSDSIIIYSDDDSLLCAQQVVTYCEVLMFNALACGILLKGSIACGLFTADTLNNVYFGLPLIDAYFLEEEMKVASIILHHTFENRVNELDDFKLSSILLDLETPMKGFKVTHKHINWMRNFNEHVGIIEIHYNLASGSARLYVENTKKLIQDFYNLKTELSSTPSPINNSGSAG